jgi:hypothetical protein
MNHNTKVVMVPHDKYAKLVQSQKEKTDADNDDSQIVNHDFIEKNLPTDVKKQALALLHYLGLKWSDGGEVILPDGYKVEGTNILEFLLYTQDSTRPVPQGITHLYATLAESDAPKQLIKNLTVLHRVEALRELESSSNRDSESEDHSSEAQDQAPTENPTWTPTEKSAVQNRTEKNASPTHPKAAAAAAAAAAAGAGAVAIKSPPEIVHSDQNNKKKKKKKKKKTQKWIHF